MTILPLVTGEDAPILNKVCKRVTTFDDALVRTIQDMEDTMLAPQEGNVTGIGLAAPQVGIDARIMLITLNVNTRKDHRVVAMVNPEIIETATSSVVMEEGCLSLPEVFGKVRRPRWIKATWQNERGDRCERKFDGWDARIFLHELDHLDGILFTSYL